VNKLLKQGWPRHWIAGGDLVNVDRQEAAAVIVGMEQRELLPAMDEILGAVDERGGGRRLSRAIRPYRLRRISRTPRPSLRRSNARSVTPSA
jgi:hypothetical protein